MSERQINNLTGIGTIETVDGEHATVRLGSDVVTPPIRFCVPFAGTVNSQRKPSIGEQVVLLNVGNGDCLSTMVIVGYMHSVSFPAPHSEPDKLTVDTGGYVSHTDTKGSQTVTGVSITRTTSDETINSGKLTINASTTITKALTAVTGAFSKALTSMGISLSKHTHTGNGAGNKTTPPN